MTKKRLVLSLPENHFLWSIPKGKRSDFIQESLERRGPIADSTVQLSELIEVLREIKDELSEIRRHLSREHQEQSEAPVEPVHQEQKPSLADHLRRVIDEVWGTDEEDAT